MTSGHTESQFALRTWPVLWRAFALPFRQPVLAATCGLVPFVLLVCGAVLFLGANILGGDPHPIGMGLGFPIDNRMAGRTEAMHWLGTLPGFPIFHWTLWLLSLAVLGFWLAAWQRGILTDFADSTGVWLQRSLVRTAHVMVAIAAWLFLPLGLAQFLSKITNWVVIDWAKREWYDVLEGGGQWPLVGVIVGFVAIPPIWLFARLSLLPPLVATGGWREALRQAWAFGRGRNRSLFLSYLLCLAAGEAATRILAGPVFRVAGVFIHEPPADPEGSLLPFMAYMGQLARVIFAVNDAVTVLILFWCATFAALIVRETLLSTQPEAQVFD